MAGDTIQAAVRAYYKQQATSQNNAGLPAEQMLAGLLQTLVAPAPQSMATHNARLAPSAQMTGPGLTVNDLQDLKQQDPDNIKENKPKAYLNYVFFDKQFKFVSDGSGVKQVDGDPGQLETLSSGKVVAKKNGYVYVYTSNESQQDVFFDNLGVEQATGPVLEETHYYPFGLTMSAISTVAPMKLENRVKFQGQELQHKEFSDGSGLEIYQFKYRMDDPQTGRFWQIDPLADKYVYNSPYAFSENKVTSYIELEGLESVYMDYRIERDIKDVESGKIDGGQLNERLDVRAKSGILALGVGLTVDAAVEEFGLGAVIATIRKFFGHQSKKKPYKWQF